MLRSLFIVLALTLTLTLTAQDAYWICFSDKDGVSFNPYEYFDSHTIDRRLKQGIALVQESDLPVKEEYTRSVGELAEETGYASRWFNALSVRCEPAQLEAIRALPFVREIIPMQAEVFMASMPGDEYDTTVTKKMSKLLDDQLMAMGRDIFLNRNIDGRGVRIAIFDAGFSGADISPAFDHIRNGERIIATWDFKKNKEYVYHGNTHGTMVWSCIAGNMNGHRIGLATGAEFLLARTEGRGEPFSEESNWVAALEWADKHGADVINSSLGYTYHRYFPEQMDGKTAMISRAATMAARKGILVVNAAGNEGSGAWKTIGAPADADSILSIGGINPETGYHTAFSSYGPATDGRIKPNVCAFGHVAAASKSGMSLTQGTSFASPLTAGFAACAWQAFPDDSNMDLLKRIERSASLYPYYDYAHGYGIPQAGILLGVEKINQDESCWVREKSNKMNIRINSSFKAGADFPGSEYLYCHIRMPDGRLRKYWVVDMDGEKEFEVNISELQPGDRLFVFYKGYIASLGAK